MKQSNLLYHTYYHTQKELNKITKRLGKNRISTQIKHEKVAIKLPNSQTLENYDNNREGTQT